MRWLFLLLYYLIGRHLPNSASRWTRWTRPVRGVICRRIFKQAGKDITIERGAYFGDGSEIEIGDNSGIGISCRLYGPIRIGRDVMMGPEVIILTRSHRFDRLDVPMRCQGQHAAQRVEIADDVWIGTRAIILPGVSIGRGAVVGAGAVVTTSVPEYAIMGGNPARVIRYRIEESGRTEMGAPGV